MDLQEFEIWVRNRWGASNGLLTHIAVGGGHEDGRALRQALIPALGLVGEAGEVSELIKKGVRDRVWDLNEFENELGDVLHYLTILAAMGGTSLQYVVRANVEKLEKRDRAKGGTYGRVK